MLCKLYTIDFTDTDAVKAEAEAKLKIVQDLKTSGVAETAATLDDVVAKGSAGRRAMKDIKGGSGNRRYKLGSPPDLHSIPKLPQEFLLIKSEEINNYRRSEAITLKQNKIMKKKEIIRLMEKQGLNDTSAYNHALNGYMVLLTEDDDVENIAPVFNIESNIEENNNKK